MDDHSLSNLPVYQKSMHVYDMTLAISTYFSSDSVFKRPRKIASLRNEIAFSLVNDALLIPKVIRETLNSNNRENRLKNATFINTITKNILSYCNGLEKDGVKEREYVDLLRSEIKVFKKTFKTWRKSLSLH